MNQRYSVIGGHLRSQIYNQGRNVTRKDPKAREMMTYLAWRWAASRDLADLVCWHPDLCLWCDSCCSLSRCSTRGASLRPRLRALSRPPLWCPSLPPGPRRAPPAARTKAHSSPGSHYSTAQSCWDTTAAYERDSPWSDVFFAWAPICKTCLWMSAKNITPNILKQIRRLRSQ